MTFFPKMKAKPLVRFGLYSRRSYKQKDAYYSEFQKLRTLSTNGRDLYPYGHGKPFPFKVGDMYHNPKSPKTITVVLEEPTQGIVSSGGFSKVPFKCVCWIFKAATIRGGKTVYKKKRVWHTDIEKMVLLAQADKPELKAYVIKNDSIYATIFSFSKQEAVSALRNKTGNVVLEDDLIEAEIKKDAVVI